MVCLCLSEVPSSVQIMDRSAALQKDRATAVRLMLCVVLFTDVMCAGFSGTAVPVVGALYIENMYILFD